MSKQNVIEKFGDVIINRYLCKYKPYIICIKVVYSDKIETQLRNVFASSCVESVARRLQVPATDVYDRMKRVELFRDLIYPCYDTLHTQSREIITEDILEALRVREEKLKTNKK